MVARHVQAKFRAKARAEREKEAYEESVRQPFAGIVMLAIGWRVGIEKQIRPTPNRLFAVLLECNCGVRVISPM